MSCAPRWPPSTARARGRARRRRRSRRRGADAACRPSALFTFRLGRDGPVEDELLRGLHPMMGRAAGALAASRTSRSSACPSAEDVYLFHGVARDNPNDERLFAVAEVRDLTPVRDDAGRVVGASRARAHARGGARGDPHASRPTASPSRPAALEPPAALRVAGCRPDAGGAHGAGGAASRRSATGSASRWCWCSGRMRDADGTVRAAGAALLRPRRRRDRASRSTSRPDRPLEPLDEGARRIIAARRRGLDAPGRDREAAVRRARRAASPPGPSSSTTSTTQGRLVPVDRPPATNPAGVVVGLVRNLTERYPEGMPRVALLGDPTHALGSLAEPECRRIIAALDLAEELGVPARVVRALGGGEDRDGQRHREHGLDRRGAAADRGVHAGAAARSTSS